MRCNDYRPLHLACAHLQHQCAALSCPPLHTHRQTYTHSHTRTHTHRSAFHTCAHAGPNKLILMYPLGIENTLEPLDTPLHGNNFTAGPSNYTLQTPNVPHLDTALQVNNSDAGLPNSSQHSPAASALDPPCSMDIEPSSSGVTVSYVSDASGSTVSHTQTHDGTPPPLLDSPQSYSLPEDLPDILWTEAQCIASYGMSSNSELMGSWEKEVPINAEEPKFRKWCTGAINTSRPSIYKLVCPTTMDNAMKLVRLFLGFAYKHGRVSRQNLSLRTYTNAKVWITVSLLRVTDADLWQCAHSCTLDCNM